MIIAPQVVGAGCREIGEGNVHFLGANLLQPKRITSGQDLEKKIEIGVTLVDFGAPWYAPCRLQEAVICHLAVQYEGKAMMAEMNIDENLDVARNLGIRSIPTLIIFKNGKEIQRFVGLQSEAELSEALRRLLT